MKKICLATLFTFILFSYGCSNQNTNQNKSTSPTIIESETIVESTVETTENETTDNAIELPNKDGLTKALTETLVSMGVDTVPQFEFDNYKNISGIIDIDAYAETEKCKLLFDCSYIDITDSWSISFVKNSDNQHIYWIQKGLENKVDLYDYNTDTLISAKSETLSSDPVGDSESQAESINDDFEKSLESIADKYQIETKQD